MGPVVGCMLRMPRRNPYDGDILPLGLWAIRLNPPQRQWEADRALRLEGEREGGRDGGRDGGPVSSSGA